MIFLKIVSNIAKIRCQNFLLAKKLSIRQKDSKDQINFSFSSGLKMRSINKHFRKVRKNLRSVQNQDILINQSNVSGRAVLTQLLALCPEGTHQPNNNKRQKRKSEIDQRPLLNCGNLPTEQETICRVPSC